MVGGFWFLVCAFWFVVCGPASVGTADYYGLRTTDYGPLRILAGTLFSLAVSNQ